jgi:S1-C subfamily serine protease
VVFGAAGGRSARDPSNDLQFDPFQDRDASSRHAEVTREGPDFWISDLGSTNGTFLNGERVTRHALKDGDVIAFGRGGPKLKFSPAGGGEGGAGGNGESAPAAPPAAVAPPAAPLRREQRPGDGDAAKPDIAPPKLPGPNTMKMILQRAAQKAKSGQGSSIFGGTAAFVKEVIRQARDEATASVRLMLMAAAVLFLLLFVLIGWLAWELYAKSDRLGDTETKLATMRAAIEQETRDRMKSAQEAHERDERERRERWERRERELEQKIAEAQAKGAEAMAKLDRDRHELEALRSPHVRLQEVARQREKALYLVYCRYEVRRKPDASPDLPPAPQYLQGFGTGFCVSPEGHIVTNKHVVKPWLFARARADLDRLSLEVKRDPITGQEAAYYAVWPAGTRVMSTTGSRSLEFSFGFNNLQLGNLSLLATAPDEMRSFQTEIEVDGQKRHVSVHAHDPESLNDVAVLKVNPLPGETLPYMPMASAAEIERLRKGGGVLQPILAMGFPRGVAVLEEGIANPSPTIGFIRKVERTLHLDASISPGNSGGPVLNDDGVVLGIATRIADASAETHGFAVPVTKAFELLPDHVKPK